MAAVGRRQATMVVTKVMKIRIGQIRWVTRYLPLLSRGFSVRLPVEGLRPINGRESLLRDWGQSIYHQMGVSRRPFYRWLGLLGQFQGYLQVLWYTLDIVPESNPLVGYPLSKPIRIPPPAGNEEMIRGFLTLLLFRLEYCKLRRNCMNCWLGVFSSGRSPSSFPQLSEPWPAMWRPLFSESGFRSKLWRVLTLKGLATGSSLIFEYCNNASP